MRSMSISVILSGAFAALFAAAAPAAALPSAAPVEPTVGDPANLDGHMIGASTPSNDWAGSEPFLGQKVDFLPGPQPFSGHGPGWYGLYNAGTNGVFIRQGGKACYDYPSQGNCGPVGAAYAGEQVWVRCQRQGQTIGDPSVQNPYWVYVNKGGVSGYMASYHIANATNWIDGVPVCP